MSEQPVEEMQVLEQVFEVTHSESIAKLVEALAKAQLAFKPVLKQVENAAFTRGTRVSKYADLAEYIDATQEALATNGLVVLQWPNVTPDAKTMTLESILAHSSGEWMRGRLTLPALGRDGFTPQSCGSSITYARRYSYAAITGCASEDDDGNAASGRGTSEAAQAVGDAKVAELKSKAKKDKEAVKQAIFYIWHDPSQTAEIVKSDLVREHWKTFKPFWDGGTEAVVLKAEQLEDLKFYFEKQQGILLKQVERANA